MKCDCGFWDKDGNYKEDIQEIDEMEMKETIIDGVNVAECRELCKKYKTALICTLNAVRKYRLKYDTTHTASVLLDNLARQIEEVLNGV